MLIPAPWRPLLETELSAPYFAELVAFVEAERRQGDVYPPSGQEFAALERTPPESVRVVLLGQDPYHGAGQAHGLSFSVARGVKPPPSLVNIFKELESDLGLARPGHGNLEAWARQGVLLLNTVLTVRAGEANSHRRQGWERLTDAILSGLARREEPIVFLLWGSPAQDKQSLIGPPHVVLAAPHPSPLSAHRGFFGARPFSQANAALKERGRTPIDWRLDD